MLDSYVVYFSLLCASVYLFFLNASMSTGLCCNKCECIAFLLWLVRSVGNVALALKTYLRPNNRRINLFKFSQTVEITTNTLPRTCAFHLLLRQWRRPVVCVQFKRLFYGLHIRNELRKSQDSLVTNWMHKVFDLRGTVEDFILPTRASFPFPDTLKR